MDKYNNKKESNKKIQQCLKEEEHNILIEKGSNDILRITPKKEGK